MNSHLRTLACAASLLILAACGGKDSVASKSAAAYREAQAKGAAPAATTETVDHSAHAATTDPAPIDHSAHAASTDPAPMDHSAHAATSSGMTDHSAHAATSGRAATHHSAHAATTGPAATDHSAHTGSRHTASAPDAHAGHAPAPSSTSHAQHNAPATADPHAHHRTTTATAPTAAPAPSNGSITTRIEPASTLRPDDFDAPVAVSVAEAKKTGGSAAHADHGAPVEAGTIYACPMHPEVTSTQPGTCPKCGMALVKRTKQ